jgi:DNA-binding transcriptional LysR family regulator
VKHLEDMAIFARVVELKSFSAAARHLYMSKSLVSKHVTQLEKSLGARLLNRTTRAMSLTEAGAVFYDQCARIMEELEAAKREVSRLHCEPRGLLRISSSVAFGSLHIVPFLPEFPSRYPEVKVSMTITDRFVDLAEEGYDVTVRITQQPAENVIARRLAGQPQNLCDSAVFRALWHRTDARRPGAAQLSDVHVYVFQFSGAVAVAGNGGRDSSTRIWQPEAGQR